MALQVYDPKTRRYVEEAVSGEAFLKYLYETAPGRLGLEALVKRRLFQSLAGLYCNSKFSRKTVPGFARKYQIDLTQAVIPAGGFPTFNDFFARRLKDHVRPWDPDPRQLISPADGRVKVEMELDPAELLQIKGMTYRLSELTGDPKDAATYRRGTLFTIRLNPTDYHRFHYPTLGQDLGSRSLPGHYYSVNPMALKRIPELYLKNKRIVTRLQTHAFGPLLLIQIGATSVGSIRHTHADGPFAKGDEKGYFQFGGSTILLLLPPAPAGQLILSPDLLEQSRLGFETLLPMGATLAQLIQTAPLMRPLD